MAYIINPFTSNFNTKTSQTVEIIPLILYECLNRSPRDGVYYISLEATSIEYCFYYGALSDEGAGPYFSLQSLLSRSLLEPINILYTLN
jgi:hypothetical protein